MHTGKRNFLRIPEDEQYIRLSSQFISGNLFHIQNKLLFPALVTSKNFDTTNDEADINTKTEYFIFHNFQIRSIAELNTSHYFWS